MENTEKADLGPEVFGISSDLLDQPRQLVIERQMLGNGIRHIGEHPQPLDFLQQLLGRGRFTA